MALFDSLNKMAKNLGEMAGDAMENGKLNMKIMEEKGKLNEAYMLLGETMYQQAKSGEDKSKEINDLLIRIDDHHQAIEAAKQQVEVNKAENNQQATPVQAAPAPAWDAQTQSAPVAEAPEAGAAKFCPGCGTKLDEGAKFCANCGTAL
ncbi:MAG: zinc ribbon domain-containing protein [Firmicutes bacterium]|nr:zinc ribbon domain-containing protein [Bacillota bacterium]